MLTNLLLPEPDQLRLDTLTMTTERITLDMTAIPSTANCPVCRGESTRVHSRYQRTVADLAWAHTPVALRLHVDASSARGRPVRRSRLANHYRPSSRRLPAAPSV